jgi:predicted amidophosphoribosyltransferase
VAVSQSFSRVRVWVEAKNLDAARTLLTEAESFGLCSECGAVVGKEDAACPQCGVALEDEPAGG